MKLIVGLGNPGRGYADSRHNVGFSVIKALSKIHGISLKRDASTFSSNSKGEIEGMPVVLAVPVTYMNLSGKAVTKLIGKYGIDIKELLVVCDDLDLDLGRIKIKPRGSSGGHRGLQSIIECLGTQNFCRLRLGISRPREKGADISGYVLDAFNRNDKSRMKSAVETACECCGSWVSQGVEYAMNTYNKKNALF